MHMAMIEYARNVCHLEGAHSTEMQSDTPHPDYRVDHRVANRRWCGRELRSEDSDLGGTMRLGAQPCQLVGSRDQAHREFMVQSRFLSVTATVTRLTITTSTSMEAAGMRVSGWSQDGELVEIIELPAHPWFVACQFHPEFKSRPAWRAPSLHKLYRGGASGIPDSVVMRRE